MVIFQRAMLLFELILRIILLSLITTFVATASLKFNRYRKRVLYYLWVIWFPVACLSVYRKTSLIKHWNIFVKVGVYFPWHSDEIGIGYKYYHVHSKYEHKWVIFCYIINKKEIRIDIDLMAIDIDREALNYECVRFLLSKLLLN